MEESASKVLHCARAEELQSLITTRNSAFTAHLQQPTTANSTRLQQARARLQAATRKARSAWVLEQCSTVNDGITAASRGAKAAWDTVKRLKTGLQGATRRSAPAKMRKADGTLANSPEENATVFAEHFDGLYGRAESFDASVLDLMAQRPTFPDLDHDRSLI